MNLFVFFAILKIKLQNIRYYYSFFQIYNIHWLCTIVQYELFEFMTCLRRKATDTICTNGFPKRELYKWFNHY